MSECVREKESVYETKRERVCVFVCVSCLCMSDLSQLY